MRRGSNKPCPGCGQVKAWLEEQVARLDDDEIIVSFGKEPHWNEYIHTRSKNGSNLRDIFHRLVKAGSRPSPTYNAEFRLLGKIEGMSGGASFVIMPRPLAEAVRDLRNAVAGALQEEYEAGKRDGHNLLIRLAEGDLSMNDFDVKIGR